MVSEWVKAAFPTTHISTASCSMTLIADMLASCQLRILPYVFLTYTNNFLKLHRIHNVQGAFQGQMILKKKKKTFYDSVTT